MATIKVKYKGKWMDPDDVAAAREALRKPAESPAVAVAALPERKDLDTDVPFDQLFFEHPEVRSYITSKGKMRSGLTREQRGIALGILDRYGIGEKEATETVPPMPPRALAEGTDRAMDSSGSPEDDLDSHNDVLSRYGDKA